MVEKSESEISEDGTWIGHSICKYLPKHYHSTLGWLAYVFWDKHNYNHNTNYQYINEHNISHHNIREHNNVITIPTYINYSNSYFNYICWSQSRSKLLLDGPE